MNPAFGGFYQQAYVTTDLDQALAVFRDAYGVPSFLTMDANYEIRYRGLPSLLNVRMALCNLNGVQIEVIEPREGCVDLYLEGLPKTGFGMAHHHVAVRIEGDFERWKRWRAEVGAGDRAVAMEGDLGPSAQFIYLDDRARLGHYTEYLWSSPEGRAALEARIPTYLQAT
jgi:hypothetical protein